MIILYGPQSLIIGLLYSIFGFVSFSMADTQQLTIAKLMLKERGWIYAKKHEGWYSVSDETFYPESGVQLALDPATGRKFTVRYTPQYDLP